MLLFTPSHLTKAIPTWKTSWAVGQSLLPKGGNSLVSSQAWKAVILSPPTEQPSHCVLSHGYFGHYSLFSSSSGKSHVMINHKWKQQNNAYEIGEKVTFPRKKNPIQFAYGESGLFFFLNGQIWDWHLEECIKPLVTRAFISLINWSWYTVECHPSDRIKFFNQGQKY